MLYWIAAWKMDSNGIKRRVPLYCYHREGRAKSFITLIESYASGARDVPASKPGLIREIASLKGFSEFHIMSPVEYADRQARAKERYRQNVSANEGICPSCESDFGRQKGRTRGRRAWRCLKCGHIWMKVSAVKPLKQNYRPSKDEAKVLRAA